MTEDFVRDHMERGAALHEAAHAVVGYLVSGGICPWRIYWDCEKETPKCSWDNPYTREVGELKCCPRERQIMAVLAGDLLDRKACPTIDDHIAADMAERSHLTSDEVEAYLEATRKMLEENRAAINALTAVVLPVVVRQKGSLCRERIKAILEKHLPAT